ncbi:MAG: DUF1579 domain-containing protein [Pirellulales bacterium]
MASSVPAQAPTQLPQPTKEHELLKKFVGEWESTAEAVAGPNMPAMTCKGRTSARMLGGFWVVIEGETDMMGMKIEAVQTIGYDPAKKKYVGTWVDSMFNHKWDYTGAVDAAGMKLTLEAEGPNFMADGKLTKFRDIYEFKSADQIEATSSMLGEDGKWIQFMTAQIKRKKLLR